MTNLMSYESQRDKDRIEIAVAKEKKAKDLKDFSKDEMIEFMLQRLNFGWYVMAPLAPFYWDDNQPEPKTVKMVQYEGGDDL